MTSYQIESEAQCPWCLESISLLVDPSVDSQNYIEDCSVCCRPIQVRVSCEEGELISIETDRS